MKKRPKYGLIRLFPLGMLHGDKAFENHEEEVIFGKGEENNTCRESLPNILDLSTQVFEKALVFG